MYRYIFGPATKNNVPLLNYSDAYTELEAGCEQCLGFDLKISELTHFKNGSLLLNY
jgi:hypothetical protein